MRNQLSKVYAINALVAHGGYVNWEKRKQAVLLVIQVLPELQGHCFGGPDLGFSQNVACKFSFQFSPKFPA